MVVQKMGFATVASPDFSSNQVHRGCESAKSVFARNAYADGRNSPMQTECSTTLFEFAPVEDRKVVAGFDGGTMTSNAGGLLLGGADKAIKLIERVAKCFVDRRDPSLIEHSVATLVGQRIFGLALGYEDLNDHDALRHDPLFAVLASKLKARRTDCAPVAGKSTLNRLERSKETPSLYHKIGHDGGAIEKLLVDLFLESHARAPEEIILDLDATDDPLHGEQEGRFFHGYYDCYCYLRCTFSAATNSWSPNCAGPTSTRARARPMKLRG